MIYLIKSSDYLKVGFSDNFEKRLKSYRSDNPNFLILDTLESGTKQDENNLHKMMEKYLHYGEWFRLCPEVLEIWSSYTSHKITDQITGICTDNIDELKQTLGINEFTKPPMFTSGTLIQDKLLSVLSEINSVDTYKVLLYLGQYSDVNGKVLLSQKFIRGLLSDLNITNKTFRTTLCTLSKHSIIQVFDKYVTIDQTLITKKV